LNINDKSIYYRYPNTYVVLSLSGNSSSENVENPSPIVIISVTDALYRQRGMRQQNASVYCYACHHSNYRFISIDVNKYYTCGRVEHGGYSKHCVLLRYMLSNPEVEWFFLLDADMSVVNLTRKIDKYLPSKEEKDIHIIFYERFNGEIQSAGFFIRNHPWSHRFLAGWLEWLPRTINFTIGKGDNGALHMHLLDYAEGVSQDKRNQCWRVFQKVHSTFHTYHNYVGCVKCALGYRWTFKHFRILRRGHTFARDALLDARLLSDYDFLIHGEKDNMTKFYSDRINTDQCCDPQWKLPIRKEIFVHNKTEVRRLMLYLDKKAAEDYPTSIGVSDISHCWPKCTSIPNQYWKELFFNKVCRNATWLNI
jgi:hypothetical protein